MPTNETSSSTSGRRPSLWSARLQALLDAVLLVVGGASAAALVFLLLRPFALDSGILRQSLRSTLAGIAVLALAGALPGALVRPRSRVAGTAGAMALVGGAVACLWAWTGWDGQNVGKLFASGPLFWPGRLRGTIVTLAGLLAGAGAGTVAGLVAGRLKPPVRRAALAAPFVVILAATYVGRPQGGEPSPPGSRPRLVMCGIDGVGLELLRDMMRRTSLPHLERLITEVPHGDLLPEPPFSPPSWSTLATGKLPVKHRIDNWDYNDRATGRRVRKRLSALQAKTIFEIAAENGLESAVLEWPIVGRIARGLESPVDQSFVFFLSFGTRLRLLPDDILRMTDPKEERYIFGYRRAESGLMVLAPYFWRLHQVDLLGFGIKGTDSAQHKYWASLEPERYGLDPKTAAREADYVPSIYRIADRILGEFMADPGIDLLVFSDHGATGIPTDRPTPLTAAYKLRIAALLRDWGYLVEDEDGNIDWEKTRLYGCSDNNLRAQVCVNITDTRVRATGKPPEVLLEVEGRADIERVAEQLRSIRYVDTGEPLFTREFQTRWSGHDLTDSWIVMETGKPPVHFPNFDSFELVLGGGFDVMAFDPGLLDREITDGEHVWKLGQILFPKYNTGNHRVNGFFAAWGPNFDGPRVIEGARTSDIVPTALHLLGLPVGRDMDGRVLMETFDTDSEAVRRPVRFVDSHEPPGWRREKKSELSAYERRLDQELKGLGYIN